ncbi:MAG: cysteine--tRNA ligase [Candidatus Magasanikbacteria bacterium CG10_big_fil_rev_8_21_14_0_10_40_10]|uniref:Cysteine--tRNA ligase n=1 Tax=Candidatus Magasanikbacteria bacterium CG10_big_fil_rev_8_21_14_0_10_40_10 TaxID=1974648 RepID=A0A2M6W3Q5_9BACT|nr:MAG: cysteine--tRNA ligase [Candidatus Magasanikbacteria bacterium CG10_big_fil_rev_8_21_14_0_10_40_10]
MEIKLYNSLNRKKEKFKPLIKGQAGFYACGPTVYNYAHIGNLRTYVFEDILKRVLQYNGYDVKHVMNITDVGHLTSDADDGEDKMEKSSRRENKTAKQIANFYTTAFKKDLKDLNIIAPNIWCPATKHIKEQIDLVKKLEQKGFIYKTADGLYFNTAKLKNYGFMAGLKKQKIKPGARIGLGEKINPTDFAVWKFSPLGLKRQMEWPSPWGTGFPGWHLECSAMSSRYLGQPFDIHCGGIDHIPVHHTNEIAQSQAAYGKPLANYWLHGEFLLLDKEKMAKSSDNFLNLPALKNKGFNPLAFRYFLLLTHYRKQLNFSWLAMQSAQQGLNHLYQAVKMLKDAQIPAQKKLPEKFQEYINNDLNTPGALALIWNALKNKKISYDQVIEFDQVLGLNLKSNTNHKKTLPVKVKALMARRQKARADKDWPASDKLRDEITQLGYTIKDTADGAEVEKI